MNYTEEELNIETEKPKTKTQLEDNIETLKILLFAFVMYWLIAIFFVLPFIGVLNYLFPKLNCI